MDTSISEKAVAQITEEGIEPSAEFKFQLKRGIFWTSSIIALVVGSLAVAVTLYIIADGDRDVYEKIGIGMAGIGWTRFLIYSLPYFWLSVLTIFIVIAHFNFRHTKFGYRYSLWQLVAANILLSILVGALFYACGIAPRLDYLLAKSAPFYKAVNNPRIKIWSDNNWSRPDWRLVAGEIKAEGAVVILVEDLNNRLWRVNIAQAQIRPRVLLSQGELIKVIGRESPTELLAQEIRPWFSQSSFFDFGKYFLKERVAPGRNN